jgi:hypothetical protein
MALFQHWTTVSKKVVFETRLLSSLSNDIPNEPLDIPLGVLFPLLLTRFPWGHVRNCRQWINSQQHPALSKDLITGSRAGYCPYFRNISVGCHLWLLHTATQTFFYLRKGAAAPLLSRVSASLRSIPSLTLRNEQALDCIHPAGKTSTYQGFLRKPSLSIFSYVGTCFQKPKPKKQYSYLRKCEYFRRERVKDYEP